jgi:hypothetical protein
LPCAVAQPQAKPHEEYSIFPLEITHKRIFGSGPAFLIQGRTAAGGASNFQTMENRFSDTFPKRFAASLAENTDIRTEA